eukprot:7379390-Prymnesium_polylepis.1
MKSLNSALLSCTNEKVWIEQTKISFGPPSRGAHQTKSKNWCMVDGARAVPVNAITAVKPYWQRDPPPVSHRTGSITRSATRPLCSSSALPHQIPSKKDCDLRAPSQCVVL